jgi:hypothetical protein
MICILQLMPRWNIRRYEKQGMYSLAEKFVLWIRCFARAVYLSSSFASPFRETILIIGRINQTSIILMQCHRHKKMSMYVIPHHLSMSHDRRWDHSLQAQRRLLCLYYMLCWRKARPGGQRKKKKRREREAWVERNAKPFVNVSLIDTDAWVYHSIRNALRYCALCARTLSWALREN